MGDSGSTIQVVERKLSYLQTGCWFVLGNLFLAAFCAWGVYASYSSWKFQTGGETTTGTVTRLNVVRTSEGSGYAPVVEYQVASRSYSFESDSVSDPPDYEPGEQVNVRYLIEDPATARIDSWTQHWLFPATIIPAMLLTALILNFYILQAWRRGEAFGD